MKLFSTRLLAAGALLLGAAAPAHAATPANGEVSKANPKVQWTGEVINSYANRIPVLLTEDDTMPCLPQHCDSFALKVAESDDLVITADAPEGTSTDGSSGTQVTLRIRKPDGSVSVHTSDAAGVSPEKPLVVKIKKAPAGDYTVEYFNYYLASAGFIPYTATATLGTPAAAAPAAPALPVNAETPQAPSPPAAQEALSVEVKTGRLSAKKLNRKRKLAASVTVSREVKTVRATLKSGSKVVGKGKLAGFSGTKALSLKLRKKLKKGTYKLTVAATDSAGSTGIRTIKLKVRK